MVRSTGNPPAMNLTRKDWLQRLSDRFCPWCFTTVPIAQGCYLAPYQIMAHISGCADAISSFGVLRDRSVRGRLLSKRQVWRRLEQRESLLRREFSAPFPPPVYLVLDHTSDPFSRDSRRRTADEWAERHLGGT